MSNGMHWFRFYNGILTDMRITRIAYTSEQPRAVVIGFFTIILCMASESQKRGTLLLADGSPILKVDIARESGLSLESTEILLELFIEMRLMNIDNGVYSVTTWKGHSYFPSTRRCGIYGWRATRVIILERDNHTCQYCGKPAAHVDHIVPVVQGGSDAEENLVAACQRCNLHKSGRTPREAGMELRNG